MPSIVLLFATTLTQAAALQGVALRPLLRHLLLLQQLLIIIFSRELLQR
jgi:hypothetical protein